MRYSRSTILNFVTWPASLVPGPLVYNVTAIVQMDRVRSRSTKTEEENEEKIIKLDVSLSNRQNIK